MEHTNTKSHIFLWLLLGVVTSSTLVFYLYSLWQSPAADLPVHGQIPKFRLASHHQTEFGLQHMMGKLTIVDFIFTSCGSACPTMTSEMLKFYDRYENDSRVQFLSISVDPETDTIERLTAFAESYGVYETRWTFARGEIDSISALAEKGFLVSGEFPGNHSTKFILVDSSGQIRGYYDSFDGESLKQLALHIDLLLADMR